MCNCLDQIFEGDLAWKHNMLNETKQKKSLSASSDPSP